MLLAQESHITHRIKWENWLCKSHCTSV